MRTKKLRTSLEVLITRLGLATIPYLPRPLLLFFARTLGLIGYLATPKLRRIGRANLNVAFGSSLSPGEMNRILRDSFQSFSLVLFDSLWFSRNTIQRIQRYVCIDPALENIIRHQGAGICITGHIGNWEVFGLSVTANGMPLTSVAANLKNPRVNQLFLEKRKVTGQTIIPQTGAVRKMLRVLKDGEKVALVMDQNMSPDKGGIFVDIFGLPATMSPMAAALARKTGCPLFIGVCIPKKNGTYITQAETLDPSTYPASDLALSQVISDRLCAYVRAYPENWCWVYKRWKHYPPEADRTDFPFYSSKAPGFPVETSD